MFDTDRFGPTIDYYRQPTNYPRAKPIFNQAAQKIDQRAVAYNLDSLNDDQAFSYPYQYQVPAIYHPLEHQIKINEAQAKTDPLWKEQVNQEKQNIDKDIRQLFDDRLVKQEPGIISKITGSVANTAVDLIPGAGVVRQAGRFARWGVSNLPTILTTATVGYAGYKTYAWYKKVKSLEENAKHLWKRMSKMGTARRVALALLGFGVLYTSLIVKGANIDKLNKFLEYIKMAIEGLRTTGIVGEQTYEHAIQLMAKTSSGLQWALDWLKGIQKSQEKPVTEMGLLEKGSHYLGSLTNIFSTDTNKLATEKRFFYKYLPTPVQIMTDIMGIS